MGPAYVCLMPIVYVEYVQKKCVLTLLGYGQRSSAQNVPHYKIFALLRTRKYPVI